MEECKLGYSTVKIPLDWRVLEIGGGANPCPRADVITNYQQSKNQRSSKIKQVDSAEMLELDMQDMSVFKDKEFDYSICVQTIEHVDNPAKACKEIIRVSKRGYIETPSSLCENLIGWPFHKWLVCIAHDDPSKLVFTRKGSIHHKRMGDFFWDMFYKDNPNRAAFQRVVKKYSDLWITKFHWEEVFQCEVLG